MQTTTVDYKLEIKKPSRAFECRVTIGSNVYSNEDIVDIILETIQPNDGFSVGNTTSQTMDLVLINNGDVIYSTSQIKLEIGIKIGSNIEYIPMGYFNIDDIEKSDYTTKITAFDNMIKFEIPYFSALGDTATLQQIASELTSKTGVQFVGTLPAYTVKKLEGFTCREVLGYIASICGGNALICRDGSCKIVTSTEIQYSITGDNYFDYKREEVVYKIGKITCKAGDKEFVKGSLGIDSMELQFENPWVTDSILTDIYNKLSGFSYLGYTMKWQGDLSLDIGDIVSITDKKGVVRKVPILSQKFTYTGGLTCEIAAKGETKNKNSFNSSGGGSSKIDKVVTELLMVKEALIDKANIQDLEAVKIRTQTLEAKTANIENAIIDVAHISDLNAINAKIENLIAEDVKINTALIDKASIGELNALNAKIVTMEVSIAKIGTLEADVANIKTLVNGNLTSDNIHSLVLTANKVTVENGFVKNAMVESLDVAKVNAGDISTNKFRITSDSGRMVIQDNTIQISDTVRVRVQIGKDASNDYSMYVWDSTGKLMFDATGLKADGIKAKIIRDDMISDSANISAAKINISSVVTSINNGATTINSSKVLLDGTAQTLNVAFNSLSTKVNGVESTTNSNTTSIGVQQGKIEALISNTTIIKNGVTTQLKDDYNATVIKVDSMQSTIGSHTTSINEVTGKVTGVETKVNDVKRDLDGTIATVSGHTSQINGLSSTVNTQGSSISQLQSQISLKVEASQVTSIAQTEANKAVNDLQVGCVNRAVGTATPVTANFPDITKTNICPYLYHAMRDSLDDKTFTMSFDYEVLDMETGPNARLYVQNTHNDRNWYNFGDLKTEVGKHTFSRTVSPAWTEANGCTVGKFIRLSLRGDYVKGNIRFSKVRFNVGIKDPGWTPAPEDVDEAITTVNTTLSEKIAGLNVTTDGILASVSEVQTTLLNDYPTKDFVNNNLNKIDGNIASVIEKQTQLEQTSENFKFDINKIINDGVSKVTNKSVVIDENGMTVGSTGSEFTANMDVTGFYVNSFGEQIARYDYRGANMKDLIVTGRGQIGNWRYEKLLVNGVAQTDIHFIEDFNEGGVTYYGITNMDN